ncbi:MAG: sulfotransferase domain-containing protein [Pseudomonadota bacterium]
MALGNHRLRIHCGHHRCGTVWFHRILKLISERLELSYHRGNQAGLPSNADLFFEDHSRIEKAALPPFLGSHIRRDPRDLIISAYHYHLWSKEPWLHQPREKLGGRSYQEHMRTLDPDDGIIFEMERSSHHNISMMLDWDYRDDRFIEIAYEDLIADEEGVFDRLFRHYQFEGKDHKTAVETALCQSFKNVTKRSIGDVKEGVHMRSGAAGQWQDVFTPRHIAKFKELFGEEFGDLGYSWVV